MEPFLCYGLDSGIGLIRSLALTALQCVQAQELDDEEDDNSEEEDEMEKIEEDDNNGSLPKHQIKCPAVCAGAGAGPEGRRQRGGGGDGGDRD